MGSSSKLSAQSGSARDTLVLRQNGSTLLLPFWRTTTKGLLLLCASFRLFLYKHIRLTLHFYYHLFLCYGFIDDVHQQKKTSLAKKVLSQTELE
jgi:hypothetical protein